MRAFLQISLVALIAVSISACGFHLRGQLPVSEAANVLFVDAKSSDFVTALEKRLVKNGATLVNDPSAAKVSLQIIDERVERATGTLDERGKANSYQLVSTVDYTLTNAQGEVLKQQSLSESRIYNFDSDRILQQEREEKELLEDMNQELVLRLVRQLSKI